MYVNDRAMAPSAPIPRAAARSRAHAGTLAAACIAVFIAQIANAMPVSLNGLFQQSLHTQGSELTWITAAFQVTVVIFELTFGVLVGADIGGIFTDCVLIDAEGRPASTSRPRPWATRRAGS